jgi:hypothetical protein
MCLIFVVMTTYPHAGMNSWVFKLNLMQRPGYLFADFIGARSFRTSYFIFPSVSPRASVLVRGICLRNQFSLAIKNVCLIAAFERAVMERMGTNLT